MYRLPNPTTFDALFQSFYMPPWESQTTDNVLITDTMQSCSSLKDPSKLQRSPCPYEQCQYRFFNFHYKKIIAVLINQYSYTIFYFFALQRLTCVINTWIFSVKDKLCIHDKVGIDLRTFPTMLIHTDRRLHNTLQFYTCKTSVWESIKLLPYTTNCWQTKYNVAQKAITFLNSQFNKCRCIMLHT